VGGASAVAIAGRNGACGASAKPAAAERLVSGVPLRASAGGGGGLPDLPREGRGRGVVSRAGAGAGDLGGRGMGELYGVGWGGGKFGEGALYWASRGRELPDLAHEGAEPTGEQLSPNVSG